MSRVSTINKSFVYVLIFFAMCFLLTSLIFKKMSAYDLDLGGKTSSAERTRTITLIRTAICIEKTICRHNQGHLFYEYNRGESFNQKLKSASNSEKDSTVPNIVHFTKYAGKKTFFRFHELLAVKAVQKLNVDKIFLWFDYIPFGENWMKITEQPSNLILVHRMVETNVSRNILPSEIELRVRLEAVLEFGGIGLEMDILLLKPLDHLFKFDFTCGTLANKISNSVVIAKPWSTFLTKWFVINSQANKNVSKTFMALARKNKDLLHVVPGLIKPGKDKLSLLYKEGKNFVWKQNVICVKLWLQEHGVEHGERDIKEWNCTAGEIFRHIYGKIKL